MLGLAGDAERKHRLERNTSIPIASILSALKVVTAWRGFFNQEWLSSRCERLFLWTISILSYLAQSRSGSKRRHKEQRRTVDSNDILVWPDRFWCFREELCQEFLRSDNYRAISCSSDEWLRFISARQPPVPPPK
jgi:hypothetical protein